MNEKILKNAKNTFSKPLNNSCSKENETYMMPSGKNQSVVNGSVENVVVQPAFFP